MTKTASYKLQQALEIKKYWIESKYTDGNPTTAEAIKRFEEITARTQIIVINGINTFIFDGKVVIKNLPAAGAHHWQAAHYKVYGINRRPFVKVAGQKMYLDEMTCEGDVKVCTATTTKAEEWKYYCIGLQTHFVIY